MKKLTTFKMRNRKISGNLALGLLLSMGSLLSFAQTITTSVSTGTSTSNYVPINANYGYTYSQEIYLASDFNVAVAGQPNYITKIRFYNTTGTLANSDVWTIFMGNTATASFATTSSWIPLASLTQVYSGSIPAVANAWTEITLTTPFLWDGVSNVVVGVDENVPSYTSNNYWRYQSTGANRSMYYYSDSNNPDPASPPAGTRLGYVPHAQFVHTPSVACSGMPNHATAVASVSSVCSNTPTAVNFSATGGSFVTGLTYQWQSNDGSGWVDYPTGTTETFSTNPTATVNVRLVTTCTATGDQDFSEETSVVVNPAPTVAVDNTVLAYCSGSPAQVVATGAATYAWSPATGLNVTNNDTVNANPTAITTYSVIGTDLMGCKDTATVKVYPLAKIEKAAAYTPATLCTPGTPVTVTASALPAVIYGGGAYEYKFIGANGAILQDWSASNTYNFTPAADSIYKVYTDFRSNTCADAVDSILTSIVVGFGADVSVVDYDCINLGGTVSLASAFGQTATQTMYSNPLADLATDAANITFTGAGTISGGRGILTPSATGTSGSITITDPAFHPGANNAMTLSFKMTADQPINVYGTGGADGISYSFGDDVSLTGHQNGSGSKLRLSFDAAGNSPNQTGIYLVYGYTGGVTATGVTPTGGTTLFYTADVTSWKLKTDAEVVFTIDVFGKASLTIDGATIFSGIQMPAAYMNANTSTWKQVFGAATGGDAMRQAIKDVQITAPSFQVALTPTTVTPATWQTGLSFPNIQPGTYDVWMSSTGSASCAKMIETVEILNTNPLVLLGNDTTICEGESLTLDAGNAGATYVWSNSQITTQTRVVTQAGPYVVNVTAANGCVGVGSINVDVMGAPTASTIYVQNNMPTYTFTILNPQNANQYSWDFGDGATIANAPGTVTHTYTTAGPRMVSVTLTNDCGTETVVTTIVVTSTADVATNTIEGLSVYPNPASEQVMVQLPTSTLATGSVFSTTGSLVRTIDSFTGTTAIAVSDWTPGVYFLHIQSEEKTSIIKLVVE